MSKLLVVGASGFVGGHLARGLLASGHTVRCLARKPASVDDLKAAGCEIVQGDISDAASMLRAMEGVQAVYISIHTLSPQPGSAAGQGFMDVEQQGLENIVAACRAHGARRLIYVTSLGITADSPSRWLTGRWKTQQSLLNSGLDVTVICPGQIVGVGGRGFDNMVASARKRVAVSMGNGQGKWRGIAVDDLVYDLIGVLDEPRAFGQCYDVGCNDVLTYNQMIDLAADVLGRPRPIKIDIPKGLLIAFAPLIERMTHYPPGAVTSYLKTQNADGVGDPAPIHALLPKPPMSYRQAVERALKGGVD